jgi:hypothetical protein
MNNRYFQSKFDYIDLLFGYFDRVETDEYFRSHIAKYLTVIISGIYEDLIKRGIDSYLIDANTEVEIRNYVGSSVSIGFRNPDSHNLKALLKKFSQDWSDRIKVVDSTSLDAIDSIVNNKNLIAHGANCEITYDSIKEYYINSKSVLIEIDRLLTVD